MILYKNKKLVIPTGINPHYLEDSSVLNNQDKEITITSNGKTTLVHDPGFSGLGTVKINTYIGEQVIQPFYSTTITENGDYDIFPDEGYDAIAEIEVTVNVQPKLQDKTVDSSTNEQVITHDSSVYGLSSVTVNPYVLDEKTVDSSTREQVITSDVDGLKSVTVIPYVLTSLELDSSTNEQRATGQFGSVKINPYTLDDLTLDSSTNSQLVEGQYGAVTVNPYVLDSSSLTVTENGEYAIESSADGLSRVDVSVNIDTQSYYNSGYSAGKADGIVEGIAEQKAKLDSSTFTSNGTYTREDGWNEIKVAVSTVNNQNKIVDSSINSQTVTYDSGYTGLGTVTVNPYTLDSSSAVITKNGDYVFESSADGLSRVDVSVNISTVNNQALSLDASINQQILTPSAPYTGFNPVTVNAVTAAIDSNIQAGNIKSGVSILGVTGTLVGDNYESYIENGTYVRNQTGKSNVYFDTGVTYPAPSNTNFLVEIKFSPIYSQNNSPQWIMGCSDGDDSDLAIGYHDDLLIKWFNANTVNTAGFSPTVHIVKYAYNSRNTVNTYLDGKIIGAVGSESYEGVRNIYLFKANYSTNLQLCYPGTRIYYVKIYAKDNKLHEFIPAYNNNKYCFYDKATGRYIYAQGGTATGHIY